MTVLRFSLPVGGIPSGKPAMGVEIIPFDAALHGLGIAALVAACRSPEGRPVQGFAPARLASELASRPGRATHVMVAWPAGAREPGVAPVGLVSLVVTGQAGRGRFSIASLLVHPATRRCGVATALVVAALDRARALGATEVFAETLSSWPDATAFWQHAVDRQPGRQPTDHGCSNSGK